MNFYFISITYRNISEKYFNNRYIITYLNRACQSCKLCTHLSLSLMRASAWCHPTCSSELVSAEPERGLLHSFSMRSTSENVSFLMNLPKLLLLKREPAHVMSPHVFFPTNMAWCFFPNCPLYMLTGSFLQHAWCSFLTTVDNTLTLSSLNKCWRKAGFLMFDWYQKLNSQCNRTTGPWCLLLWWNSKFLEVSYGPQ